MRVFSVEFPLFEEIISWEQTGKKRRGRAWTLDQARVKPEILIEQNSVVLLSVPSVFLSFSTLF